jgi:hypothetical protein
MLIRWNDWISECNVMRSVKTIDDERLERIERMLQQLVDRTTIKSHYTVEEFAALVKRATFTVRQWCNEGRIHAEKSMTRSGLCSKWIISHQEYERFQREGLLPLRRRESDDCRD